NREAIRLAQSGEMGKTQMIFADAGFNMGDPTQWRLNKQLAGGGAVMGIGIYALNAPPHPRGEGPPGGNAASHTTPGEPRLKKVEEHIKIQLRVPSGRLSR